MGVALSALTIVLLQNSKKMNRLNQLILSDKPKAIKDKLEMDMK